MSDGTATPFGKYELLDRLGAGGMAIVYRARYTAAPGITKPVVIKRVLSHYAEDKAFVEMFIQEARVSVGLNHGNIVQVFDFGQVDGEYFLAMELVDGQPLSRLLKKAEAMGLGQLPPPLAVSIAIEMCKGLHHAHTRKDERGQPLGLVHRDISPDNVLISYEGEVKISDFGIAKAQMVGRPVTESGVVKGKFRYLSPEQAYAVSDLDARSDVYAVGVVLYRMLCGQLPADGKSELAVMQRIANGQLTPPRELAPELDDELVQILRNALATDREARTPSAEALHLQLSQWAAVMAPLFPVHTLKHLLGLLYESELTAMGRTPELPPRFREQVAMWGRSQQRQQPRTDSVPSTDWPGTPGSSASQRSRAPRTDPDATRPNRRVSRPGHRATQTMPEAEGLADETQEMAPVEVSLFGPRAGSGEAKVAKAGKGKKKKKSDPYEGVHRFLMRIAPHWRLVIGALVVAVMLVKVFMRLLWPTPPLTITSEPPGALVSIDRMFQGVTPLMLENVPRSEPHTVELSRVGMKGWSHRFEPGTLNEQLRVILEPASGPPAKQSPPTPAPSPSGN